MKKIIAMVLLMSLLLSGCGSLTEGEYHSVKPHSSSGNRLSDDVVTVSGYEELKEALVEMVTSGKQKSTFYINDFEPDKIDQSMNMAIMYVFQNSAIGAYAVDEITFESGTSGGLPAIAVGVTYIHNRQEILRIKSTSDMQGVKNLVAASLRNCDTSTVIKVSDYIQFDVEQYVKEYVDANPHQCMELPQVSASIYPKHGKERVIEISFTYQNSRADLLNMQNVVEPMFAAAEVYVQSSEGEAQKYEQLYAFLMERFDYQFETSLTPAYSLIRYGVGDSKAFAMVYSIMCQNADLSCEVVSGTKNGEAYYWNMICYDDICYHVDLLASSEAGEFQVMLPEEMSGYVWDYSLYEQE